jgi:hypothetical protein
MSDNARNTPERLEEARQRVSDMLAVAAVLGAEIGPEEISRGTLVPILPIGELIAAMLANLALRSFEGVARILAGLGDDRAIAMIDSTIPALPPHRPRRSRPTAADRARRATEWLAGPARELGPEPEPSPDGGAP